MARCDRHVRSSAKYLALLNATRPNRHKAVQLTARTYFYAIVLRKGPRARTRGGLSCLPKKRRLSCTDRGLILLRVDATPPTLANSQVSETSNRKAKEA